MKVDISVSDKIFQEITPLLRHGRPGDYQHIKSLYKILIKGYEDGSLSYNPRIMLPATLLHDVGFGFIKEKYIHFFTGQGKVAAMRDAAHELTLGFIPTILSRFEFSQDEIGQILEIVRFSDDSVLQTENPSRELVLLHDLNLYDRLSLSRLRELKKVNGNISQLKDILEKSISLITDPILKKMAEKKFKKVILFLSK